MDRTEQTHRCALCSSVCCEACRYTHLCDPGGVGAQVSGGHDGPCDHGDDTGGES